MFRPALMKGSTEFYPFCYLLIAADTALDAARQELPGRNYHYVIAVTFSAFAVEASVNHVGIDHYPEWSKKERDMGGWEKKLTTLAKEFGMVLDFTTRPAKTVKEAFEIRDKLAHGKTWVGEQCYYLDDDNGRRAESFPDWLKSCMNESRAKQVIDDARELISRLLEKADYEPTDLNNLSQGKYKEGPGPVGRAPDRSTQLARPKEAANGVRIISPS